MAIPPFPSQDLAKLVLGYLIEEQLMTAYDEFLHQSPFLDAEKNEFDRIAMQPLRHLLGEYRAVKIYVESCKPIALRRRLFQCPNLLEVVKLLVQYVDVKRVQEDLCRDQVSADSQEPTSRTGCEACLSLKLESCVCNNRRRKVSSTSINNSESVEAGRTIATNTLSDLSGNQNLDNRHVEVTASHTNQSNTISQQELLPGGYPGAGAPNVDQNSIMPNLNLQPNPSITITQPPNVTGNATAMECSQNIAEFNTVLNQVYNKTNVMGGLRDNNSMMSTDTTNNNRIPNCQPESFQDFSTGVRGPGASSTHINVPDSSTTENLTVPLSHPDTEQTISNKRIVKKFQKRSCAFRVGNVKHDVTEITSEVIDVDDDTSPNPKLGEQKVTILSNVKVGNDEGLIKMSKNATSTPLLQFQTICLNGTPIFKPKSVEQRMIYTKDEIMAMPTLILVPASGPSNTAPTVCQPQTISAQSSNITTSTTSAPPTLTPLTVDVSNSTSATCNVSNAHKPEKTTAQDTTSQSGLVKTVESLRNASVPKDNTVPGSSSTSTPQGLPPMRKSSSTPRRTISHVRVLDFTTPRRILNEAISENPNEEAESDKPVEIMISKSPNVSFPRNSIILDNIGQSDTTVDADKINESESNGSVKKKIVESKKRDWDADLRALVAGSQQPLKQRIPLTSPKSKPKKKTIKKTTVEKENIKNKTIINTAEKTRKKSSVKNSDSVNNKLSKKKDKPESVARPEENVPSPTVSPIGIMQYAQEKPAFEPEKVKDKSNDEEHIVTPEVERLSLRNEIGGKLNISDILETPYKQALYEIQMETPRFLGPDIPDDPMSDIKITDIPTPRFLTSNTPFTPKPKQATPSSYSSRPTDYSSGGSYYKPDDQDYLRIVDDTICPVTSTHSKDNSKETVTESTAESDLKDNKPKRSNRSRPVRQCTKNVSYYNSPMTTKSMNSNKKDDVLSCSDSASANSSFENAVKEDVHAPRSERKHATKSENRSKLSLSKKRSPLKKVTQKSFMKIKPRHTPTKDSSRKSNRKSSESSQVTLKGKPRMRTSCKVPGTSPHAAAAPTKRRRKSATPRKLHRTEFKSSDHDSPEAVSTEKPKSEIQNSSVSCVQDSDTEQLPLRWSDDGSQESRAQGETESNRKNEDEISKIKEYIDKTMNSSHKDNEMSQIKEYIENTMVSSYKENEGSLQNDLIKRGFDIETAKKIERDLLSTPVPENRTNLPLTVDEERSKRILERPAESESTLPKNVISEEEYLEEDFSVYDCKEGSANYLIVQHDGIARPAIPPEEDPKLKDKFSLEICIDDGDVVRLRASSYNILMDEDFQDLGETIKETEMAVSSISNIDRLYTPMKDHIRAQCYSIFDSTLTSIDTPLKADSPSRIQNTISVTIEDDPEEIPELREKTENRKRKRLRCSSASDESVTDNKRVKPDTHMILTKDLKNMDIEVLLAKLHGSTKN
ncbi:microtubule-associated protein futsch-like [Cydia strobilella]|uniref:microtubule-associated protein futsch-like n=1 Tax=Cydia strobilella TaxID=1100964 RepID=UPI003003F83A